MLLTGRLEDGALTKSVEDRWRREKRQTKHHRPNPHPRHDNANNLHTSEPDSLQTIWVSKIIKFGEI